MTKFQGIDLHPFVAEWECQRVNSEQYESGYWPLLKFGENVSSRDDLVVLAHAVYGWMPTILDRFEVSGTSLPGIRSGELPDEPMVNRSWIGTSKLLHFLAPTVWPIWDSRVAQHFGFARYEQQNRREVYSDYANFLRDEAANYDNPTEYCNLRFLELCLFSYRA